MKKAMLDYPAPAEPPTDSQLAKTRNNAIPEVRHNGPTESYANKVTVSCHQIWSGFLHRRREKYGYLPEILSMNNEIILEFKKEKWYFISL